MLGKLITSKAGHDKDQLYMVIKIEQDWLYLADGKGKTLEHPKKKNKKHVQPINYSISKELVEKLENGQPVRNEEIKRELKLYSVKTCRR